jgi:hypothetical protein
MKQLSFLESVISSKDFYVTQESFTVPPESSVVVGGEIVQKEVNIKTELEDPAQAEPPHESEKVLVQKVPPLKFRDLR